MINTIPKIYYISQGLTLDEHLLNIKNVCKAGCKMVQLRLKNVSNQKYLETAIKAKEICRTYSTTFIINDNLKVAVSAHADGIHLGKTDISISNAKAQFSNKIIGGTANTLEDCISLINQDVNYIGLGPFKFTETKTNLSSILGLKGYQEIILKLKSLKKNTPIIAIGGVKEADFNNLFNIGINTIAVSGLLTGKPKKDIEQIIQKINLS